jgi:hypothetical protein
MRLEGRPSNHTRTHFSHSANASGITRKRYRAGDLVSALRASWYAWPISPLFFLCSVIFYSVIAAAASN